MNWPLANATRDDGRWTRKSGNDCIRTIDAKGCTTASQNDSQRSSGSRLTIAAPCSRAYSMTIGRHSGSCRVSASRNQSHSPRASAAATCRACVLPVQPGGRLAIEISLGRADRPPRTRGRSRPSRRCCGRPRPGFRGSDTPAPAPTPGRSAAPRSSSLAGMMAVTSGYSGPANLGDDGVRKSSVRKIKESADVADRPDRDNGGIRPERSALRGRHVGGSLGLSGARGIDKDDGGQGGDPGRCDGRERRLACPAVCEPQGDRQGPDDRAGDPAARAEHPTRGEARPDQAEQGERGGAPGTDRREGRRRGVAAGEGQAAQGDAQADGDQDVDHDHPRPGRVAFAVDHPRRPGRRRELPAEAEDQLDLADRLAGGAGDRVGGRPGVGQVPDGAEAAAKLGEGPRVGGGRGQVGHGDQGRPGDRRDLGTIGAAGRAAGEARVRASATRIDPASPRSPAAVRPARGPIGRDRPQRAPAAAEVPTSRKARVASRAVARAWGMGSGSFLGPAIGVNARGRGGAARACGRGRAGARAPGSATARISGPPPHRRRARPDRPRAGGRRRRGPRGRSPRTRG